MVSGGSATRLAAVTTNLTIVDPIYANLPVDPEDPTDCTPAEEASGA